MLMASGGARNRSGPAPSDSSLTSARRGIEFRTLDALGYVGVVPDFPLPPAAAAEALAEREAEIWERVWSYPQAIAWAEEPWRHETVAEFCRLKAIIELAPDANAALVSQMHRYRDQIGLSPAGLKENGWKIGEKPASEAAPYETAAPSARRTSSKARLKVVPGGGS